MRIVLSMAGLGLLLAVAGCGRNPCSALSKAACEKAPGTPACEKATRLTAVDECQGYLKDVQRYVDLSNLTVTTPGVKPPAPPAPPAPAPAPEGTAVPAAAPVAPPPGANPGTVAPAAAPVPAPAPATAAPAPATPAAK